jgi:hypothetical protein
MILLAEPVGPQDRAAGLILRLRLVALDAGNLHFPAKSVLVDGVAFEVPALRIPVSPARIAEDPPVPEKTPEAPAPEEKPAPLFPDSESSSRRHPVLFAVFRRDFGNIYRTARNWWDRGYRAEALAELRKHERDHPASSLFLSLRRDAERNMGLARTGDESPRIVQLAYLLGGVFFTLALGLVCFRLPAGLRGKKAIKVFVVLCAAVSVVFFYRFIEREMPGYPRSGVLKETSLRRIPDSQGTVTARFSEGQAGRLPFAPEKTGDWVWISIQDENGAAGWVPKDQVVFY